MAFSSTPERDEKDQGEDSSKQAGSCWFAHHCLLATSGANLYSPGGCCVVFLWCYVCFLLFRFRFFLSLKPRPFLQSFFVLRYTCAPTATRSYLTTVCVFFRFCFFLFLVSMEMSLFRVFMYHYRFRLCMESMSYQIPVRFSLPDGVFYTL